MTFNISLITFILHYVRTTNRYRVAYTEPDATGYREVVDEIEQTSNSKETKVQIKNADRWPKDKYRFRTRMKGPQGTKGYDREWKKRLQTQQDQEADTIKTYLRKTRNGVSNGKCTEMSIISNTSGRAAEVPHPRKRKSHEKDIKECSKKHRNEDSEIRAQTTDHNLAKKTDITHEQRLSQTTQNDHSLPTVRAKFETERELNMGCFPPSAIEAKQRSKNLGKSKAKQPREFTNPQICELSAKGSLTQKCLGTKDEGADEEASGENVDCELKHKCNKFPVNKIIQETESINRSNETKIACEAQTKIHQAEGKNCNMLNQACSLPVVSGIETPQVLEPSDSNRMTLPIFSFWTYNDSMIDYELLSRIKLHVKNYFIRIMAEKETDTKATEFIFTCTVSLDSSSILEQKNLISAREAFCVASVDAYNNKKVFTVLENVADIFKNDILNKLDIIENLNIEEHSCRQIQELYVTFIASYCLEYNAALKCFVLKQSLWGLHEFFEEFYIYVMWKMQKLTSVVIDSDKETIFKLHLLAEIQSIVAIVNAYDDYKSCGKERKACSEVLAAINFEVRTFRKGVFKYLKRFHPLDIATAFIFLSNRVTAKAKKEVGVCRTRIVYSPAAENVLKERIYKYNFTQNQLLHFSSLEKKVTTANPFFIFAFAANYSKAGSRKYNLQYVTNQVREKIVASTEDKISGTSSGNKGDNFTEDAGGNITKNKKRGRKACKIRVSKGGKKVYEKRSSNDPAQILIYAFNRDITNYVIIHKTFINMLNIIEFLKSFQCTEDLSEMPKEEHLEVPMNHKHLVQTAMVKRQGSEILKKFRRQILTSMGV